jgi:hypothetical protein
MNSLIREVWEEEFSKLSKEDQEKINNLSTKEIMVGAISFFLNPLNWFGILFAFIKGLFKGVGNAIKKLNS